MGKYLMDGYTLLHFASGIIAHHWSIPFGIWVFLHILFEYFENTNTGMHFINNYITFWPGGKPSPDTILNRIGDTVAAVVGWFLSYLLLKYSPE